MPTALDPAARTRQAIRWLVRQYARAYHARHQPPRQPELTGCVSRAHEYLCNRAFDARWETGDGPQVHAGLVALIGNHPTFADQLLCDPLNRFITAAMRQAAEARRARPGHAGGAS